MESIQHLSTVFTPTILERFAPLRVLLYNSRTFLYNMPMTNPTAAAPITPYTLPLPTMLSAAPPVKAGEFTRVLVPIVPTAMAVWLP